MNAKQKAISYLKKKDKEFLKKNISTLQPMAEDDILFIFCNKAITIAIKEAKKEVFDIIKTYQNPYPKDIFVWDSKSKLDFNRGRFHQHCYEIVENMRADLLKEIEENQGE